MYNSRVRNWKPAAEPPSTARTIRIRLTDGRELLGFYWRADDRWYPERDRRRGDKRLEVERWTDV